MNAISESETTPAKKPDSRQERRAAQRTANEERARKMHAAWMEATLDCLPGLETEAPMEEPPSLNVGCSGWYYREWKGKFYPESMPSGRWFDHYAEQFQTVELNAPFYSWPTVDTVKTWLRQAGPRRLIYTVKVCELITHAKRFRDTGELVRDFGYIATLLGEHMGCFLFQMPPGYDFTLDRLKRILSQLNPARRNVVEFRHPSWWNEKVYDAFRETGTIFCSCSTPNLPDELVNTAGEVYLRFHGATKWYLYNYSTAELEAWRDRVIRSGARRVWAYFNNTMDGSAVDNAREFRDLCLAGS
ncbi:MAG: hypothetical protein JWM59_2748 [Verrucomicrobiales bacterium]|nr:hypothetical protein [Verrucomicrobiales bacterium]